MRRSFFLMLAAGLLASLAPVSSGYAGTMIETFAQIVPNGIGGSAKDIELTFTGGTLDGFVSAMPGSIVSTYSPLSGSTTVVTITFASAETSGFVDFTYNVGSGAPSVTAITLTDVTGATLSHPLGVVGGSQILGGVPEPSSMALLGIGMAGFFACRRLFKRNAV